MGHRSGVARQMEMDDFIFRRRRDRLVNVTSYQYTLRIYASSSF